MIVIAPNLHELNDLVVSHDYEFRPYIDQNGDIAPDFEEVFKREWKGFAVNNAGDFIDDFAISGSTATQIIGQDMWNKLLESIPLYIRSPKKQEVFPKWKHLLIIILRVRARTICSATV